MSSQKTIISSDGHKVNITDQFCESCITLKGMYEDTEVEEAVPITEPNCTKDVIEFMLKYNDIDQTNTEADDDNNPQITSQKDRDYMKNVEPELVAKVIEAASFLDYPRLKIIASKRMARYFETMTVEEVRRVTQVENDFTPEQLELIKKQHQWLEDEMN